MVKLVRKPVFDSLQKSAIDLSPSCTGGGDKRGIRDTLLGRVVLFGSRGGLMLVDVLGQNLRAKDLQATALQTKEIRDRDVEGWSWS